MPLLNLIVWNGTVLTFIQRTYAKLNCLKNIVLTFNYVEKIYLYKTKLFDIELSLCMKRNLTLNNL